MAEEVKGEIKVTPSEGTGQSEEDRLLNLYWNRAELKKAFSGLREEKYQFLQKIKQQEGALARAREEMRDLETLLADPEAGFSAMCFFQLRGLWRACNERLMEFSRELAKQQEDRERKRQVMQFNQERQERLKEVNQRIGVLKTVAEERKTVLDMLQGELDQSSGFWNYFKRRRLQDKINENTAMFDDTKLEVETLFDRRMKLESEPWPEFGGLAIDARRTINLAVLALAQHLYLHFSEHQLVQMAKKAMSNRLREVTYGTRKECEFLMRTIQSAIGRMQADPDLPTKIRHRTAYLKSTVSYRQPEEAIPTAESLTSLQIGFNSSDGAVAGTGIPLEINVLADDYWDVYKVLFR